MREEGVVGRGELKLAEAAKAFGYDFRGKTVLDIGSSTGGFTEYALRQGAKKVIAVEKGTRQMKAPLRYDERVELYEKTDFFEVLGEDKTGKLVVNHADKNGELTTESADIGANKADELAIEQGENVSELVQPVQVGVVLADVSFVSLTKILMQAKKVVWRKADYLVMLKPQFEARPEQLVKGAVKNEKMRREIIRNFEAWLARNGLLIVKKRDNETVGKVSGNRERFYWLMRSYK